jgi:hypothetical protein
MKTKLSSFLLALALLLPIAVLADKASVEPVSTTVTAHAAADGTTYYSVALSLPQSLKSVSYAWLELRADVSAKDLNGFVDPAPVLDVYALKEALAGDPETANFEATRLPMSRPVAAGDDRLIKIDITEFVQEILVDPSKNHGIVLGPLTADKRGVFAVKQDGFGAGVAAQLRIAE